MSTATRKDKSSRNTSPLTGGSTQRSKNGNVTPDRWDEWIDHLATRETPRALVELLPAKCSAPLAWALPDDVAGRETEELIRELALLKRSARGANGRVAAESEAWLDALPARKPTAALGLEALAWCHALPSLSQLLPTAPWCELLDRLVDLATNCELVAAEDELVAGQLLGGELPLTLAYLFPELPATKKLAGIARQRLSNTMVEVLDGEGLPHATAVDQIRTLLACWTRCWCLSRDARPSCFTEAARTQYEWLAQQALRLTRQDGTLVFSRGSAGAWIPELFEAVLSLCDDEVDHALASQLLPRRKEIPLSGKAPSPSVNSEWAGLAVLRREWSRAADQVAVAYQGRALRSECNRGGVTLWSGDTTPQLRVNGRCLELVEDWEEVCWVSDHDVDYLELEGRYMDGWRVQRQILLARDDKFLFLADAVLGDAPGNVEYRHVLPLAEGLTFTGADETREGWISATRAQATVLPLQLPEWRAERDPGDLRQTANGLELLYSHSTRRVFAPLFFDLDPQRGAKTLTWRRLTVAERLQIVPSEIAVGYRVQLGSRQWLFYRSLGPRGNRTVLGQNYSTEFVAARFTEEGESEKLLEIE